MRNTLPLPSSLSLPVTNGLTRVNANKALSHSGFLRADERL
jgi:hypothetical protein